MRNMKYAAKKMAALIMAGAMAATPVVSAVNLTAITAMANPQSGTTKAPTDTVNVTIGGLEKGKTKKIYAYQVVKANWTSDTTPQLSSPAYSFVNTTMARIFTESDASTTVTSDNFSNTTVNMTKLTSAATTILNAASQTDYTGWAKYNNTEISTTPNAADPATGLEVTGETATLNLPAGSYIIVIANKNEAKRIYSPMLVSAHYATASDAHEAKEATETTPAQPAVAVDQLIADSVTATEGTKYTDITVTKKITNPDGVSQGSTDGSAKEADADDLQVGDYAKFTITSQIPNYTADYKNKSGLTLTYDLMDDQEDGKFSAPCTDDAHKMVVKVNDTVVEAGDNNANYTYTTGEFKANTGDDKDKNPYVVTGDGIDFKISFTSQFIKDHVGQPVTVTYYSTLTSAADQEFDANTDTAHINYTNDVYGSTTHDDDTVNEYSFPLVIKKVKTNGEALAGATFSLRRIDSDTTPTDKGSTTFDNQTSGSDGSVLFQHLDEGTYTLKEETAPAGYTKDTSTYTITVKPTYGADGTLTSYTVTAHNDADTDNTNDTTVEYSSLKTVLKNGDDGKTKVADVNNAVFSVTNTPTSGLPATGARSALIITIAGIAIMISVMAASKRKKEVEE